MVLILELPETDFLKMFVTSAVKLLLSIRLQIVRPRTRPTWVLSPHRIQDLVPPSEVQI